MICAAVTDVMLRTPRGEAKPEGNRRTDDRNQAHSYQVGPNRGLRNRSDTLYFQIARLGK